MLGQITVGIPELLRGEDDDGLPNDSTLFVAVCTEEVRQEFVADLRQGDCWIVYCHLDPAVVQGFPQ